MWKTEITYALFFSVLNLLIETFQSSKTHLLLANAHCPSLSFTPVCLEFALALGRLIKCTLNCLYDALCDGQPSHVSHTSRTLVTLFEQVPFNRLENGLLDGAITNLQRGLDSENPVVKIAILGIFAVLPTNHPEVFNFSLYLYSLYVCIFSLLAPVCLFL